MWNPFKKKEQPKEQPKEETSEESNSFLNLENPKEAKRYEDLLKLSVTNELPTASTKGTTDSSDSILKLNTGTSSVNAKQFEYFSRQGFIGYQTCSVIAQHWLINNGVSIPPKDAIRKGYELTFNDGVDISIEDKKKIRDLDKKYRINKNLVEMVKFGRIFGIRIALFKVESTDPDYYENPFNIDGVKAGTYKGISQIDPYWVTPELKGSNVDDPSSMDFYEPEHWVINGRRYHRTHLIIMRTDEVSDILKPSYFYGGLSYPQKVMSRVYSAERVADEAPLLAQTKRTNIYKTNLNAAKTDLAALRQNLEAQSLMQDNYGIRVIGKDDEVTNLETSLADLDNLTFTQYQIVAGIFNVPITKLLGTQIAGFSSGESEQDNYIEELENIQMYDMNPLLERHYELVIKSDLDKDYKFDIVWNSLKILSELDKATLRETDSRTDMNYVTMRALSPETVLEKLAEDKESRYHGLEIEYEDEKIEELEENEENKTN